MYLLFNCQDSHFPLEVVGIILPAIITMIIILAVLLLLGFVCLRWFSENSSEIIFSKDRHAMNIANCISCLYMNTYEFTFLTSTKHTYVPSAKQQAECWYFCRYKEDNYWHTGEELGAQRLWNDYTCSYLPIWNIWHHASLNSLRNLHLKSELHVTIVSYCPFSSASFMM